MVIDSLVINEGGEGVGPVKEKRKGARCAHLSPFDCAPSAGNDLQTPKTDSSGGAGKPETGDVPDDGGYRRCEYKTSTYLSTEV